MNSQNKPKGNFSFETGALRKERGHHSYSAHSRWQALRHLEKIFIIQTLEYSHALFKEKEIF